MSRASGVAARHPTVLGCGGGPGGAGGSGGGGRCNWLVVVVSGRVDTTEGAHHDRYLLHSSCRCGDVGTIKFAVSVGLGVSATELHM